MSASVHNFILTLGELNMIQTLLNDSVKNAADENERNTLIALREKMIKQRDSGYPAKDYPFWRKYFETSN